MNKYNWNEFPKIIISCGALEKPADLCYLFQKHGIDKYIYSFVYNDMFIVKIGMSAPSSKTRMWGERVYRQLAHAYSWGNQRIDGSSGAEWVIIERDFKEKYKVDLDHKKLNLTVWDVTNYKFKTFRPFREVEEMESEKINEHIELLGYKPIGNINDEANKRNRGNVERALFENLFQVEE